ncbi:hypothetical protein DERP_011050 [Dermatophagoides pteronyssinus]|uniref:Uncharacterized protein n=1 Tax=Dermatophagoides pteronyssinus TaxID=6956 RepID=A0ABQ8J8M5_DERPT|nr:hypothetical protein DERP_011050 [Dermatophagoides pteronyssinus]
MRKKREHRIVQIPRNNAYDGTSLLAPALCVRRNNRTRRVADAEQLTGFVSNQMARYMRSATS